MGQEVRRRENKNGEGNDKNKTSQSNSNQDIGHDNKSKCQHPGHNHNWTNYSNNPKSSNYNGTSYKVVLKNNMEK